MRLRLIFLLLGSLSCTNPTPITSTPPTTRPTTTQPTLVLQTPAEVSIMSVAVSPDGSRVISNSFDGRTRVHDARSGQLIRAISGVGDRTLALTPDARYAAAAGFHMDYLVGLWDLDTGARVRTFPGHTEWEAYACAISPDGKFLASAGTDRQILIWDLATAKLLHRLPNQPLPVSALAFSPDSSTLATGGGDKILHLWNTATGSLRRSLPGHDDWIATIAFSPDGQSIASASCDWAYHHARDTSRFEAPVRTCVSEWKLWNAATGECQRTESHPGRILSLAFSPDSRTLATGVSRDLLLYDLRAPTPGATLAKHDGDITSLAFTPDGASIITGAHDHSVRRTAIATAKTEWLAPGYHEQVNSIALSATDGALLVTGSSDGRYASRHTAGVSSLAPGAVRLWDTRTGQLLRRLNQSPDQIMAVALSPDARHVAAGGASPEGAPILRLWDAQSGALQWSRSADHAAEILSIAFTPDGQSLATASADGTIKLRNPATGDVTQTLPGQANGATSLAFSTNSRLLACGAGDGATHLYELPSGRKLHTVRFSNSRAHTYTSDRIITSIAFTEGGATLAVCPASIGNMYGEPVQFYDTRTGQPKSTFTENGPHARPIALSPDGQILATGGKTIKLWDTNTGKLLREFTGHLKKTQSITFSPDGTKIYAGGSYGTTNIWQTSTGRHLITLFAFDNDNWLAYTPEGPYDGSPTIDPLLAWRLNNTLETPKTLHLRNPDHVRAALHVARATSP
jgi:WD40 repeat protein